MLTEFRKSINSILYERLVSPLWGTFFITWIIWNWKILYLTIFVSENKIAGNKIDFIINNYGDIHYLLVYPLISTLILLTVMQFISTGAYWVTLIFQKWRSDIKNKIEKEQLLTIEQSIQLRQEIKNQETNFNTLLESKDNEIKVLKLEISELKSASEKERPTPISTDQSYEKFIEDTMYDEEISKLLSDDRIKENMPSIIDAISRSLQLASLQYIDQNAVILLETRGFIKNKGNGIYEFTDKGIILYKTYADKFILNSNG